jgi:flavin-dependent thymidylate synthase
MKEPSVTLINAFSLPLNNVVAAARTCYSTKGIIYPSDVKDKGKRNTLVLDLYRAGHHTTFQHIHFQFVIKNVSRHFVWNFLHSHPFYNSEQVSQRYVEVKPGNYYVPPIKGESLSIYENTVEMMQNAYKKLFEILYPLVENEYFRIFPSRARNKKKWEKIIKNKSLEIARYVLPISTHTHLYHTINSVTLFRYYRLMNIFDTPEEQRKVIEGMIGEVLKWEPDFSILLKESIPIEETEEFKIFEKFKGFDKRGFKEAFDESLGGRASKLIDYKVNQDKVLVDSVHEVLGIPYGTLSGEEAIELVLNPSRNSYLGETLNLTHHAKLTRVLIHVTYTFRKKLSHTADSQNQRHRTTLASRPILILHLGDDPDYIIPSPIDRDERARKFYIEIMERIWKSIGKLKKLGISEEFRAYLLPNSTSIRLTESADLLSLRHKYAMRLCLNAQEEIWKISREEVLQIREVNPLIGKYLLPPCKLRFLAGKRPYCPEGIRYCGIPLFMMDIENIDRII